MAFNFNGNTPKKILYNGLNVAKLIYNGVVVWMSKVLATIEGILPLTLTNSTGDDLVGYKIYGNSEYEGLPDGYTQVEYIQGTGTQYIDTGINVNTTTSRYETKISPSLVSGTIGIFGTRNNVSADQSSMNVFIIDGAFRLDWLNGTVSSGARISSNSNTEYAISITRGLATINNVNYTSGDTTSIDGSYTFYVGSFNNAGSVYSKGFSGKIYYSKLYNNNILVFDGVPCYRKSDNEIGMYDLVSNTFFTNAGTGTFNTGSVVSKKSVGDLVTDTSDINYGKYKIPVLTNSTATNIYLNKPLRKTSKLPGGYTELEHIRGTGTQYIDIGCKMYNNSELELCFSFDEMQQDCSIFGSRRSSATNNFEIASTNDLPIYLDFGAYNRSRTTYNNTVINTKYICTISKSLRAVYDENRTLLARNTNLISEDNVTPSNARIFDTAGGYSQNKLKGKVYYCKIWENGVLVRNMIPCINQSNVAGMYDTVNGVFYTNAGSGSFIAGAEVETVYYTDYLDYENQKVVRNVDDNDKGLDTPVEESIVLPAVPTDEGTVTVDVDTEIAPSYAEVVYYKNDV